MRQHYIVGDLTFKSTLVESALAQIQRYIMSELDIPTPTDAALHSFEDFVNSDLCKQKKKQSRQTDFFSTS